MGKPGAVSGVVGRGVLVRFGAGGCPPARGVLPDFTHFGAAAVGTGFRARAVTGRRRGALQRAWGVGQYGPTPRRQHYHTIEGQESQSATQSRDPSRAERGAIHVQSLRARGKKTDRTGRQKIGITRVLGPARAETKRADSRLGPGRGPNRNPVICGNRAGGLRSWSNVRY
jgi:hypothetical protein